LKSSYLNNFNKGPYFLRLFLPRRIFWEASLKHPRDNHQPQHEGSFFTLDEIFSPLDEKGVKLLGKGASKVHVSVYQIEVFAGLTLEENKVKFSSYKEEFVK
jgi:hypothetical protein